MKQDSEDCGLVQFDHIPSLDVINNNTISVKKYYTQLTFTVVQPNEEPVNRSWRTFYISFDFI